MGAAAPTALCCHRQALVRALLPHLEVDQGEEDGAEAADDADGRRRQHHQHVIRELHGQDGRAAHRVSSVLDNSRSCGNRLAAVASATPQAQLIRHTPGRQRWGSWGGCAHETHSAGSAGEHMLACRARA